MLNKILIRKTITKLQRKLAHSIGEVRLSIIKELIFKREMLKRTNSFNNIQLPTLGKLRLVLEKEIGLIMILICLIMT